MGVCEDGVSVAENVQRANGVSATIRKQIERSHQEHRGAQRVEVVLEAHEVYELDRIAKREGSRKAAIQWLLENSLEAP